MSPNPPDDLQRTLADLDARLGRIAAETKITCPPAVPIVAAGEIIGENEKKLLKNSGIFFLKVVK